MSAIRALERMLDAGVPLETAIEIARGFEADMVDYARSVAASLGKDEAAERRREKDRERKRAIRRIPQTSTESADTKTSPPSPKPPSTSPVSPNPFTPLKGGVSPSLAEQIWALQPVLNGKRRSTRPDVQRATEAAVGRGGVEADIEAACRAYYRLPDSTKGGGEFAMGAARLLQADRWRDFLPSPEPPAAPPDEATLARRLQHLRDTGEWKPHWGERPRAAA